MITAHMGPDQVRELSLEDWEAVLAIWDWCIDQHLHGEPLKANMSCPICRRSYHEYTGELIPAKHVQTSKVTQNGQRA